MGYKCKFELKYRNMRPIGPVILTWSMVSDHQWKGLRYIWTND